MKTKIRKVALTRRGFVALGVATFGCARAAVAMERAPELLDRRSDVVLGGGKYVDQDRGNQLRFALAVVNLDHGLIRPIDCGFFPHSVAIDPLARRRICAFEKIGPGAAEFDLDSLEVTRRIATTRERMFYGHGTYSGDGALLYATETYRDSKRGVIAVRDARSLELLGEFPTFGESPHECRLIDDGRVMVVTNGGSALGGGSAPSVCYIDVATQRVLEKVELTNERLNTGHLDVAADGSLVVVSAPRTGLATSEPGGVSIRPAGGKIVSIDSPAIVPGLRGEALSVAIDERRARAIVTHPDANRISVWSLVDRSLVRLIEIEQPRGVALSRQPDRLLLAHGNDARLTTMDLSRMSLTAATTPYSYISGSHLLNWSLDGLASGEAAA